MVAADDRPHFVTPWRLRDNAAGTGRRQWTRRYVEPVTVLCHDEAGDWTEERWRESSLFGPVVTARSDDAAPDTVWPE